MAKGERNLTPAEQKRKERFALVCEEMERRGYQKTDLTVGVAKANLLALVVMLPFAVLSGAVVLSRCSLRLMAESISSLDFFFFLFRGGVVSIWFRPHADPQLRFFLTFRFCFFHPETHSLIAARKLFLFQEINRHEIFQFQHITHLPV